MTDANPEPTIADVLAELRALRTDVTDRLNKLQADMEVGLTEMRSGIGTLALAQQNLFNIFIAHMSDRDAHGR
jgi:hypothetical protein